MKVFSKSKDGGPDSPVDAFFVVEIKSLFSVALLKFNKGGREAFHSHAFNAFTWFLCGELIEEKVCGDDYMYKRGLIPKHTLRGNCHRVKAINTSYCLTVRGPWVDRWKEVVDGREITLTHGRKVVDMED